MSPNAADDNKVAFAASADVQGGTAVPLADAAPEKPQSGDVLSEMKQRASISASMKAWDIDGDGELDDAELALKAIDKSGKGTLSKEQMYQLMNQNLSVQKELSGVKKVVFGLVGFTVVLALANVGTSFAAAYLAKDTHMEDGKLTGKDGRTVQTEVAFNKFELEDEAKAKEANEYRRELCEITQTQTQTEVVEGNGRWATPTTVTTTTTTGAENCVVDSNLALSHTNGMAMIEACENNGAASIMRTWDYPGTTLSTCYSYHHYCGVGTAAGVGTATITSTKIKGQDTKSLTVANTLGWDMSITGNDVNYVVAALKSVEGQCCDADADCATTPEGGTLFCRVRSGGETEVKTCGAGCAGNADCSDTEMCLPSGLCGTCTDNSDCGDGGGACLATGLCGLVVADPEGDHEAPSTGGDAVEGSVATGSCCNQSSDCTDTSKTCGGSFGCPDGGDLCGTCLRCGPFDEDAVVPP